MMSNSKPRRGGQRPGAGQPPLGGADAGESRNLVVRLPAQMHDQLDVLSEKTGLTRSEVARAALARALDDMVAK